MRATFNSSKNNAQNVPVISLAGASIISEFINRKRLAKIGIIENSSNISSFKAECLTIVSMEFDKMENEEMKRKMRR